MYYYRTTAHRILTAHLSYKSVFMLRRSYTLNYIYTELRVYERRYMYSL